MRRFRHEQSGFTLVEVLVASSLMLVVLSATLTTFNGFLNNNRRATNQNDQQELARRSIDQIVRQLRNLANPTNATATIAYADANKVIFQTTDPNKQWVGYCLSSGTLWYQTLASAASPGTGCPDSSHWTKVTRLVDFVTNATGSRPVFQYLQFGSATPLDTSSPITASTNPASSTIVRVLVELFIDVEPTKPPAETNLSSGAYMRNQNQVPTASFNALPASGNTYTLDAGTSSDPEQRTLKYDWYEGQLTGGGSFPPDDPGKLPDCSQASPPVATGAWANLICIGTGPNLVHDFSPDAASAFGSNPKRVNVWLRVTDPGTLSDVTDPGGGGNACLLTTDPSRDPAQCEGLPVSLP